MKAPMMRWTSSLGLLAAALGGLLSLARESEGARANSVLLNGSWEYVLGDGSEGAETTAGQAKLQWKQVTLPGPFMRWNQQIANQTKLLWARRSFNVTAVQAKSLAVLRWNRVANGAEAFINGRKVGENEPKGPYQAILPPAVLQPGENQIVLKVRGAAGVRKSRSGNAVIPAGFGVGLEVTDDVCAKTTVMALVPAASGGGRILFSQLDLQRRVDRASPRYDPAAERVLLQLLGWTSLKRQ